jgi:hypothetical protein
MGQASVAISNLGVAAASIFKRYPSLTGASDATASTSLPVFTLETGQILYVFGIIVNIGLLAMATFWTVVAAVSIAEHARGGIPFDMPY